MTSPIGATTYPTATPAAAASAVSGLTSDDFLKLLVAQLRYQDPNKPTDASSMMAQTSQLTQVESLNAIAAQQSQLLTAAVSSQASGLMGRTVDYLSPAGDRLSGLVTSASFGSSPTLRIDGADVPLSAVTGEHRAA